MSNETKPALDHRRAKRTRHAEAASPDAITLSRGSQTDLRLADKGRTKLEVAPQGALPVLSIPGGNQTDSKPADKNGKDTNVEVSSQGALPVISVPGGS
jgi:hypothetical protein